MQVGIAKHQHLAAGCDNDGSPVARGCPWCGCGKAKERGQGTGSEAPQQRAHAVREKQGHLDTVSGSAGCSHSRHDVWPTGRVVSLHTTTSHPTLPLPGPYHSLFPCSPEQLPKGFQQWQQCLTHPHRLEPSQQIAAVCLLAHVQGYKVGTRQTRKLHRHIRRVVHQQIGWSVDAQGADASRQPPASMECSISRLDAPKCAILAHATVWVLVAATTTLAGAATCKADIARSITDAHLTHSMRRVH